MQRTQPHDLIVDVAGRSSHHSGSVLGRTDKPVVVVAEEEVGRLVLVDQVEPRVDVSRDVLGTLFVGRALTQPAEVEYVAEMQSPCRLELGYEVPDEPPRLGVYLVAVRVGYGNPSLYHVTTSPAGIPLPLRGSSPIQHNRKFRPS